MTDESSAVPLTELEVITDYLEVYRRTARWKLEGLNLEQATRSLVPSVSTLLGLVKHLAYVERWWFQGVIGGLDVEGPWSEGDSDASFRVESGDTVESIITFYESECDVSRRVLSQHDDPAKMIRPQPDGSGALRDILIHMIEETARHVGHMDILREQIDGATGDFFPDTMPWRS